MALNVVCCGTARRSESGATRTCPARAQHVADVPTRKNPNSCEVTIKTQAIIILKGLGDDMTSVLIVDDHPVVLQGCRRILEDAGITTVLEASDTATGYELFRNHR